MAVSYKTGIGCTCKDTYIGLGLSISKESVIGNIQDQESSLLDGYIKCYSLMLRGFPQKYGNDYEANLVVIARLPFVCTLDRYFSLLETRSN